MILRSDLCGFSDAYIVAKGGITLTKDADRGFIDMRNRSLAFKNNAPFTNFISKINSISVENAWDLDVVMPMYNLIQHSRNYKKKQHEVCGNVRRKHVIILQLLITMQTP